MSQEKIKMLRAVFAVALFALLLWWGIEAYQPKGALATAVTVMVCLAATHGLCALIFRSPDKEAKYQPVLAPLLERHVLNPLGNRLERRRLKKWREEGRAQAAKENAEALTTARRLMRERGLNPDDFLPPERF